MRAVTVTEYGATPAIAEMPTPEPGPEQVLIKLRAAGINPMDRTLASGVWKPMPATFPMVLGADGAGVVEQLGEAASRFSLGDDLFGQLFIAPLGSAGTYAEYVAVTEDAPLARVPVDSMTLSRPRCRRRAAPGSRWWNCSSRSPGRHC